MPYVMSSKPLECIKYFDLGCVGLFPMAIGGSSTAAPLVAGMPNVSALSNATKLASSSRPSRSLTSSKH